MVPRVSVVSFTPVTRHVRAEGPLNGLQRYLSLSLASILLLWSHCVAIERRYAGHSTHAPRRDYKMPL